MFKNEKNNDDTGCLFSVNTIIHIAIKCADLDKTIKFYSDIIGLQEVARPSFGYPGSWLATDDNHAIIHLYGGAQGLTADGQIMYGTGSIDHISLMCKGIYGIFHRLTVNNIEWREYRVPNTDLYQVFFYDPNGVLLELTFLSSKEGIDSRNHIYKEYVAGRQFNRYSSD